MKYILILHCLIILFPLLEAASPRTVPMILPGTNWCGKGNIADYKDQLGWFEETDRCCKIHDECPYSIGVGKTKFFLHNNSGFTVSRCRCDEVFRDCLADIGMEFTALLVKEIFFDVLTRRCFTLKRGKKPGTWKGVVHLKPPFEELFEDNGWKSPYDELADTAYAALGIAQDMSDNLDELGETVAEGLGDMVENLFG